MSVPVRVCLSSLFARVKGQQRLYSKTFDQLNDQGKVIATTWVMGEFNREAGHYTMYNCRNDRKGLFGTYKKEKVSQEFNTADAQEAVAEVELKMTKSKSFRQTRRQPFAHSLLPKEYKLPVNIAAGGSRR